MGTTTHDFPLSVMAAGMQAASTGRRPVKHISRNSRRALRMLAHAIEYVANEFLHDSIPPGPGNARLRAVQLLLAADREVYAGCPDAPGFAERCRWFLRARV